MGNVRAKLRFFKPDKGIFNYICMYDIVYVIGNWSSYLLIYSNYPLVRTPDVESNPEKMVLGDSRWIQPAQMVDFQAQQRSHLNPKALTLDRILCKITIKRKRPCSTKTVQPHES